MKYFAILLFAAFSFTFSHAQRFQGGPLLGISVAQIDGDNLSGYDKAGLVAGAFVRTDFIEGAGIQLEIKYIGKGASDPVTEFDPNYYKIRLDYIELPVLFYFNAWVEGLYVEGGLAPAYLMQAREDDGYGFLEPVEPYNTFDIAAAGGVRYELFEHFAVNARFSYSILPVLDHPGGQSWRFNYGLYNNVLSLAVYYTF